MQHSAKNIALKLPAVLALAMILASLFTTACHKDEKVFDIVDTWELVSVQQQGKPLDRPDLIGRIYRFEDDGRCYILEPDCDGCPEEVLNYRIDEKYQILRLGGEDYQVYLAKGEEFTFGLVRNGQDEITYVLSAD